MAHTFDVTFKFLFRRSHGVLSRLLFGDVVEWPNVEQPEVRKLGAGLLARCADGSLRHVELQVTNFTLGQPSVLRTLRPDLPPCILLRFGAQFGLRSRKNWTDSACRHPA